MTIIFASQLWDKVNELASHPWVDRIMRICGEIFLLLLVWIIGRRLIRLVIRLLDTVLTKRNCEISAKTFLLMALKWFLYVLLLVFIIEHISGTTVSLVAVIGSLSVTIGLALQGSLSNVAGGVLILLMRPFRMGDYIVCGTESGTVKEIGLIYTKLMTPDGRGVVIPNGALANGTVVNTTQYPTRRLDCPINISYDSDIEEARKILTKMLMEYTHRANDEITVIVAKLDQSAVVLEMRMYVPTDVYWDALWYVNEHAKLALDRAGISIPFSQLDVHITK